jgi:hypothetical protein
VAIAQGVDKATHLNDDLVDRLMLPGAEHRPSGRS